MRNLICYLDTHTHLHTHTKYQFGVVAWNDHCNSLEELPYQWQKCCLHGNKVLHLALLTPTEQELKLDRQNSSGENTQAGTE